MRRILSQGLMTVLGLLMMSMAYATDLPGTLAWSQRVELATPLSGVVAELPVVVGQRVKAGDLLLALDSRGLSASRAEAQSNLDNARNQRAEAKRELGRAQELFDRTLLSDHELQKAKINAVAAEAAFSQAKANLTRVRLDIEYTRLLAPFDGLVVGVLVEKGAVVSNELQAQSLVIMASDKPMRVLVNVSAEQAQGWPKETPLKVAINGEWYEGKVRQTGLEAVIQTPGSASVFVLEGLFSPTMNYQLRAGQQVMVRIDE